MELFTLVVWLWMGLRFEQTQVENLSRDDCAGLAMTIEGDRQLARAHCLGASGRIIMGPPEPDIKCAACGDLPGRRRI